MFAQNLSLDVFQHILGIDSTAKVGIAKTLPNNLENSENLGAEVVLNSNSLLMELEF